MQRMALIESHLTLFYSDKAPETVKTYARVVSNWLNFIGSEERFFSASVQDVWNYILFLKSSEGIKQNGEATKLSFRTIIKNLAALRSFYKYLLSVEAIDVNNFDRREFRFKSRKVTEKRPTQSIPFEYVKKLMLLPKTDTKKGVRDLAMLTAFFAGGLRRSELIRLRIHDVKKTEKGSLYLHLRNTKGGGDRFQTLPPWAHDAINTYVCHRIAEGGTVLAPLFIGYGRDPEIPTEKELAPKSVYDVFVKYIEAADLPAEYSPHSARATAITKLLDDGVSHGEVMHFSGHQSIQMVEVYDKRIKSIENNPGKKLKY